MFERIVAYLLRIQSGTVKRARSSDVNLVCVGPHESLPVKQNLAAVLQTSWWPYCGDSATSAGCLPISWSWSEKSMLDRHPAGLTVLRRYRIDRRPALLPGHALSVPNRQRPIEDVATHCVRATQVAWTRINVGVHSKVGGNSKAYLAENYSQPEKDGRVAKAGDNIWRRTFTSLLHGPSERRALSTGTSEWARSPLALLDCQEVQERHIFGKCPPLQTHDGDQFLI
ncbi:hypothetical protein DFH06DRAFT_1124372 [Mycena polygramma]|nr:hypothetical protein DFH06DRAFT_1138458 [Mycena polygramma]KAJ7672487.1 hypothetical protein DFH06DRAFT_1124372 [Mycena polygramma]